MRFTAMVCALNLSLVCDTPMASTLTSDITDTWFNPAESGWGVNVILQYNYAFLTFFVYDANQNPVWYSAQLTNQGNFTWSGGLYANRGPWFGGAFPSGSSTCRQAGTATFALVNLNQASFTYSVDGVNVAKTLERLPLANENLSGVYAGGYSIRASGCTPSSLNGTQEIAGLLSVSQTGTSIAMTAATTGASCSFTESYAQTGKLGQVTGTYTCTDNTHGNFFAFEMTPTISGFTARVSGNNQFCQWSGYLGGISRAN